jgi:acetoin utilization deacetylase AcuC-like enzyme
MKIFYYDLRRVQYTGGSTIAAARAALVEGIGVSLGGGNQHACSDHGQGYCRYNDTAVISMKQSASTGKR